MRNEFSKVMKELIERDRSIHLLYMDTGRIFEEIKKDYPNNIHNLGLTEQATIGIASGMALEGLKPYIYAITSFILERPYEQIKLDLVAQNVNVKLIGFWDYPNDGITHKTKDVKGICNNLEIKLYKPKSSKEARKMFFKEYNNNTPAFFSLTGEKCH